MVEDAGTIEATLGRWLAPPVRVLARTPSAYASSFPLERIEVETGAGERLALVWKDLTPSALLPAARLARGGAAPDPANELRAYELLDGLALGTPRRHGALHDRERAWLFLEALDGATRLDETGDAEAWEGVARWLAHAHGALAAADVPDGWPLPWRPSPPLAWMPVTLAAPLAVGVQRVAALPAGIVHGQLYPANVLIGEDGRVCVLDWETIARGPALLDLAALTAGRWDEPDESLALAYRDALPDPPPVSTFLGDLDACRLVVAAGWLAAPPDWRPPPAQARDWLADAHMVAERIVP